MLLYRETEQAKKLLIEHVESNRDNISSWKLLA